MTETTSGAAPAPTISHILGEITWLLSQSPLHRGLTLADLEWLVMPAIIHRQFYVFRDGEQTIGLALWALCGDAAQAKLEAGILEPANHLTLDDWKSGDRIWLVDLVAPFADAANRQREIMIADLISGPLAGKAFSFHQTDPRTGVRSVQKIEADAGEKLKAAIVAAVGKAR